MWVSSYWMWFSCTLDPPCHTYGFEEGLGMSLHSVSTIMYCHDNFGPPLFYFPCSIYFEIFGPPRPVYYFWNNIICTPMVYSRNSEGSGLDSGYKWLAGLVYRVCMAGVSLQGLHGGPNITWQFMHWYGTRCTNRCLGLPLTMVHPSLYQIRQW